MVIRDQSLFLDDILESIERIEEYAQNITFETFLEDKKTFDAVIRNLEVIGEASKCLSKEFKEENSEINWRGVAGMRDKLIHGYFGIDPEIVWKTIQKRLPELKIQIKGIKKI